MRTVHYVGMDYDTYNVLVASGVVLHTTTSGWTIVSGLRLVMTMLLSLAILSTLLTFGTHLQFLRSTLHER